MIARFAVGGQRVAVVHGDADSLAGWRFDAAALFGSTYLLPVCMQLGLGLSASHVGTILLPAGLVLAVTIAGVGRLADQSSVYVCSGSGA